MSTVHQTHIHVHNNYYRKPASQPSNTVDMYMYSGIPTWTGRRIQPLRECTVQSQQV